MRTGVSDTAGGREESESLLCPANAVIVVGRFISCGVLVCNGRHLRSAWQVWLFIVWQHTPCGVVGNADLLTYAGNLSSLKDVDKKFRSETN